MRVTRRGVGTAVVVVLVVLLVIIAGVAAYLAIKPSGAGTTTVTSQASSSGVYLDPPNLAQLAQQEGGQLTMYSIIDPTSFAVHYLPAFLQAYPWAKINFIPLDPGSLVSRPIAEYKAGKVAADLDQYEVSACLFLNAPGVIQPENFTKVDAADGVPRSFQNPIWTPFETVQTVVFYNTNLVYDSDPKALPVPKTYQDLANPIYKGQVGFGDPTINNTPGAMFAGAYTDIFHGNNASWTAWMQGIKANEVLEPFGGAAFTAVSQGQHGIGLDTLNDVFNGVEAGLPVAVDWNIQPTYPIIGPSCTLKGAPHPYMAMLFDEWLLSSAGQLADISAGFSPFVPSFISLDTYIPSNATINANGDSAYEYNFTLWSTAFKNIFDK